MRIAVFCGSSAGRDSADYMDKAHALGEYLADQGIGLVYGGAKSGLMGAVAEGALSAQGEVIGVMPQAFADKEQAHPGITELVTVPDMHIRKGVMAELADAFIALPGGIGTLEELFEALTWTQLGLHKKPCGLLNINGFYDHLLAFLDHANAEQFISSHHRALLQVADTPQHMVDKLKNFQLPVARWRDRSILKPDYSSVYVKKDS